MRIGIDVRPPQTQTSRHRGIGRYVHNQVTALLRIAQQDEILLFYASHLEPPAVLEADVPGTHWRAIPLEAPSDPSPLPGQQLTPDDELRQSSSLQAAVLKHDLDLFHVTSPFEWEIAIGQSLGGCPTVVTLYDLIPLILAPIYLTPASSELRERYLHRLGLLRRADRIVAISEASKQDGVELLDLSPDRIDVISAGVDESFGPSDSASVEAVRDKYKLPDRYIFSLLGYHYTKNIEGAIAAYSRLPAPVRKETPLVIVVALLDEQRRALRDLAAGYGVRDQVVLAGEVAQSDLVALYSGATVFFYPTRYDGFGLPVAEAMRCGVPVVTSTSSCLPEVGGKAALFADPDDHEKLATLLASVLADPELRQEMREKGFAQAERFSWQRVAKKTLRAYRDAVDSPSPTIAAPSSRLRIAYWSPLNPCKSGISDYSEHLLLHLASYADVDIFVDGYMPTTDAITEHFPVYDYRVYPDLVPGRRYDINLYQMGNNSFFHEYIYRKLITEPGVVVLHDYSLQAFFYGITEARGQRERYLDEIAYSEGPQARREAARDLSKETVDLEDFYSYPLNRRVVEASLGIVVHSQWLRAQLEGRGVDKPIVVIPLGVQVLPVDRRRRALLRSSLGLAPDTLVVGCFGRIVPTKRIETVLRAFNRLHRLVPHSVLLLVGEPDDVVAEQITRLSTRYGIDDSVWVTGYVTEQAFDDCLRVSDICVNLRYPSAGETSYTLCRALGASLPVLASDLPQFAEFPDDCVWQVDTGPDEEDELVAYLLELAFDHGLRKQMGQNAQDYVVERATWPQVAAQYAGFLEQIAGFSRSS
jgi:glycosyltransferase involved in cell wall biosynthesis